MSKRVRKAGKVEVSYEPGAGEWFSVAPRFVWRCCGCGHAAAMEVRLVLRDDGNWELRMRGRPIEGGGVNETKRNATKQELTEL